MPNIEVQLRFPTPKGVWRWYEYIDDSEDLVNLLRRVVKYDVKEGSDVTNSQTLWLRTYELLVKVVASFDAKAGCYRPIHDLSTPWRGCYDRTERIEALQDDRAIVYRNFLNAKRESKVGYTEEDRAAGAAERDKLQQQLDTIDAKIAVIESEDPNSVQPPLFRSCTLAQMNITNKCIVFVQQRGVVSKTPGYLLPDLSDFRKGSLDNLRAVMERVRVDADADALEHALEECMVCWRWYFLVYAVRMC